MATEEGSGGMQDVEQSLQEGRTEERGFFGRVSDRLGDFKESYVDFHTVDEEQPEEELSFGDKPALGNVSRRGFVAGAAQAAVAGYGITEATDSDGWAIDWASGEASAGPGTPVAGNETDGGETPSGTGGNVLGKQGDVSDELYLQEDGTVIAVDFGHREWRSFSPDEFTENEDLSGLYDEVSEEREPTDLAPPGLDQGIEVSQEELFDYDTRAYNDMSDESEWDLIFDANPKYGGE